MHPRILIALLLVVFSGAEASACSCLTPPPTFCQYISPGLIKGNGHVMVGRAIRTYVESGGGAPKPYVDVAVDRWLFDSDFTGLDTITLLGDTGANCGYGLGNLEIGAEGLFYFNNLSPDGLDSLFAYRRGFLGGCGPSVLPVQDGMIFAPITFGVDSISVDDFATREDLCLAGPLPERCVCPTVVTDLCNDAASLEQGGRDVGLLRLSVVNSYDSYDRTGYYSRIYNAVVTDVIQGNDFSPGDTISTTRTVFEGCVADARGDDFVWLYTSADDSFGENTARFGYVVADYPLLDAPDCIQRFARITNDSVQTLSGSVPYDDYLQELPGCRPTSNSAVTSGPGAISIFPNPVSGTLSVRWSEAAVHSVHLYDGTGRALRNLTSIDPAGTAVDVHDLPAGVYFLRARTGAGVVTRRVVVRR